MFIKILFVVFIICTSLLTLGGAAIQAQELVSAKVLSSEGPVEIRRTTSNQIQAQKIAFKPEDKLNAGDTIITGKKGRLVLGLSDGSQAVIAPQTTVVIEDLSASPRTLFNVIRGKTRIQIEKLGGQPNPYRVNTPTAVIAVRGTVFDVLVEEEETQVYLHEGSVAVTNLRLPNQPIFLSAGQMTRVMMQRMPNQPNAFKPGRNDGSFKTRQQAGPPQNNGRIADSSGRPEPGRGGTRPAGSAPSASSRDNRPATVGGQPDFGRGGPSPNSSEPNGNARPGRRP
jgi:hypothetical protein